MTDSFYFNLSTIYLENTLKNNSKVNNFNCELHFSKSLYFSFFIYINRFVCKFKTYKIRKQTQHIFFFFFKTVMF